MLHYIVLHPCRAQGMHWRARRLLQPHCGRGGQLCPEEARTPTSVGLAPWSPPCLPTEHQGAALPLLPDAYLARHAKGLMAAVWPGLLEGQAPSPTHSCCQPNAFPWLLDSGQLFSSRPTGTWFGGVCIGTLCPPASPCAFLPSVCGWLATSSYVTLKTGSSSVSQKGCHDASYHF